MDSEKFDLSKFLPDSLSLQAITAPDLRRRGASRSEDYYKNLINEDPLTLLGENSFVQQNQIPKTVIGTPIQEFFRGVNVFITGGTGFFGKVLIEKLVRSIPHLGHIYILVRAKRGKSFQERLDQLLQDKVFSRMKAEVPQYYSKLTAVAGDLLEPGLGISPSDRELLAHTIHVVFHSAADVRLMEPLRAAIVSNVIGSRRVLQLAKEMKHLKSYVHVSTAYSHCIHRVITETVPTPNIHYKLVLEDIDSKTDEELQEDLPRILNGWPNTYTFSKAICESMIEEEAQGLPLCIFRPSIVFPSWKEPLRGWTDNLYGSMGMIVGVTCGVLHCFYMDSNKPILDFVPVDMVINCMIVAAWANQRDNKTIQVYNFTSSPARQVTWKWLLDFGIQYAAVWPFAHSIWYPSAFYTKSAITNEVAHFFLHTIPGMCLDKLAVLAGQQPRLSKIYDRIKTSKEIIRYFSKSNWEFQNDNVKDLWSSLIMEDKLIFPFDVCDVDFTEYFLMSKLGLRYFYLKESMDTIPAAKRRCRQFYWAHVALKVLSGFVVVKLMTVAAHCLPI